MRGLQLTRDLYWRIGGSYCRALPRAKNARMDQKLATKAVPRIAHPA